MARVNIPVGRISRTNVFPLNDPVGDPTNDHQMVNNGVTLILVENVGASTRNAEAVIEQTVDGEAVDVLNYSILAGDMVVLGPYPREIYGDLLLFNTDHADLQLRAFSLL